MEQCRASTLKIFASLDDATFREQIHPDFSPIGWHLGHIGYTEALWLLQHCAKQPPIFPQYHQLYAADAIPKNQRTNLPTLTETCQNLEIIRQKVWQYLEVAPIDSQERLWHFILQHESQHCETISFLLQLQQKLKQKLKQKSHPQSPVNQPSLPTDPKSQIVRVAPGNENRHFGLDDMVEIPPGDEFAQGSDAIAALDNERPRHFHHIPAYHIDRYPVTQGQYQQFIAARGYENPQYWSEAGWQWRQKAQITEPLYWPSELETRYRHPVCGVSWYEAEAFANFVGKRLPTEAEWEKAATWNPHVQQQQIYPWGNNPPRSHLCNHNGFVEDSPWPPTTPVDAYPQGISPYGCYDMLGNVWEWTASKFAGYPGFEAYPYPGYSMTYFDNQHQVLRGGSCVTRPWVIRGSFRNWYHPWIRQIFVGFRCAK
jgi:ergothioneine biosynthesis protein EgtB